MPEVTFEGEALVYTPSGQRGIITTTDHARERPYRVELPNGGTEWFAGNELSVAGPLWFLHREIAVALRHAGVVPASQRIWPDNAEIRFRYADADTDGDTTPAELIDNLVAERGWNATVLHLDEETTVVILADPNGDLAPALGAPAAAPV